MIQRKTAIGIVPRGPVRVISTNPDRPNTYVVQDLTTDHRLTVHASELYQFEGSYTDAELKHWAARNEGEYVVRKVADHRRQAGNLQFLLLWEGYDDDEGTWTDYSREIDGLAALDAYINEHPRLKLPSLRNGRHAGKSP
ncbi:Chromo (CHRromatin Organization MOdifier) domain [Carpediemonas membranifera]|uniref:Chromo (CHRromatin Organization MOdifier) domain n=1 Tax=Carpediemonas membranifera TaxID=201153 RepID=A0A8J6ATR4_9EUKA|nr:Chromo (CHRromatin Organization MOdifier) domain [Carpediemonas membranifera]|eukprot:KAG9394366.1 Chromo (CHRromatin Organization MOdifier) domain [Carpediemonas membranifera]